MLICIVHYKSVSKPLCFYMQDWKHMPIPKIIMLSFLFGFPIYSDSLMTNFFWQQTLQYIYFCQPQTSATENLSPAWLIWCFLTCLPSYLVSGFSVEISSGFLSFSYLFNFSSFFPFIVLLFFSSKYLDRLILASFKESNSLLTHVTKITEPLGNWVSFWD